MSRRYHFSRSAEDDLREIAAFIGKDDKAAARKVVRKLREVCRTTLVMFPEGGTRFDHLLPGMRAFSVGSYVIFFSGRNPVNILRIVHGARDFKKLRFVE